MEKEFLKALDRAIKAGRNDQSIYVMKRLYNSMSETPENIKYWKRLNFK